MTEELALPSIEELARIADQCRLSIDKADLESFRHLMTGLIQDYNLVGAMADEFPQPEPMPRAVHKPSQVENPHNAWYVKTEIRGASGGRLKGKRVALKDNVMLAGVPLMNGASTLEGYVPEFDATVVTRILAAGGEIAGKTHCENLCLSAGSHTNATGYVHNPYRRGYSAGGSSSGSAVVVAVGDVEMAIGGDQGGSIRVPSSFCGVYGLKPTWGLVPYTGIMPLENFIDHVGPMTANVTDNALLLEVIAGDDGYDPRCKLAPGMSYRKEIDGGVRGLRIGLLVEGFSRDGAEESVDQAVRGAAQRLGELGAIVSEASVPLHAQGPAIAMPIGVDGLAQTMMWGDGYGTSRPDLYSLSLMAAQRRWREQADSMADTTKLFLMFGTYVWNHHGPHFYGKAVNVSRRLARAYDAALQAHDLLLMPTTPMRASALPATDADRAAIIKASGGMNANTQPFNITHHPAFSVPCAMVDGLPVGMMLVGRPFDEATLYRAAFAFEQSGRWQNM